MNDEQRGKLEANVSDWLKDHVYTELTNASGVEVWRCKKPGSNNLAFDICVTRYGMAVFGDIGHLTFDVGADYGINFLRNDSLGYLHSKLAASCKAVELDKDSILDSVREAIIEQIDENLADELKPEWNAEGGDLAQLKQWLGEMSREREDESLAYEELLDCIEHIERFDDGERDIVPAFDFLAESEKLLCTSDTWEWGITKTTMDVWRKLFYARHAANAIMAQKASKEAEQATKYCYAMGPADDSWSDDGLAAFVSDRELAMGAVIQRGVVSRRSASSFLPDANEVIEHMGNAAADDNSEFADNFPDTTKEQEAELERLMEPMKAWADRTCDVNFYTVLNKSIEAYTVTAEDVAAGEAYRKTLGTEVAA